MELTRHRAAWWLRTALAVLIVLVCTLAILALPPVQTRLARVIADRIPGVDVDLEYFWAGPRGIAARDVSFAIDGLRARVDRVDVDFAFWSSLAHRKLDISSAEARSVQMLVDLGAAVPIATPAATPFAGLGPVARVPSWLGVRALAAQGEVTIRTREGMELSGPWDAMLTGVRAASNAAAHLTARLDARRSDQLVATASVSAEAAAVVDSSSRVTNLAIDTTLRPGDGERGVRVATSAALDETVERYSIDVEGTGGTRLAHAEATLGRDRMLDATWEVNVTPGVVEAFARGRSVADLWGTSAGQARVELASRRASIDAVARLDGRGWEAFDPRLADFGALTLDAAIEASFEPGVVAARKVAFKLISAARGELLTIGSLQPLRFETGSWLMDPETWGEPALEVQANDMPLRWLRGFATTHNLAGGELRGSLEFVREEPRRTTVRVVEPLRVSGVQLGPVEGREVPPLDITVSALATLSNGALDGEIESLTLTTGAGIHVTLRGRGRTSRTAWPLADFEGDLTAQVPALQRIMPQLAEVSAAARLQLDFEALVLTVSTASVAATSRAGRKLVVADLSAQQPLRIVLPQFTTDWDSVSAQSASLVLDRMPIDWVSAYLPELELRDGEVSGRFAATGDLERGIVLATAEPLVIRNVQPVFRGIPPKSTVTASVRPRLELGSAMSSFALEDLQARSSNGGTLTGDLKVEAPAGSDALTVAVSVDGDFPAIARAYGARIGKLRWRQRGELSRSQRRYTMQELSVDFADTDGTQFLELRNLRPFSVMAQPFGVTIDGGSSEILHAVVTPLRLESLLPHVFGFDLEGTLPEGEFFGSVAPGGGIVLAAKDPLVFHDVSVRWGDATLLDRVTMGVRYELEYSAAGLQARSVDLTATDANGAHLVHSASEVVAPLRNGRLVDHARFVTEVNLAPLTGQPVLVDLPPFTSGTLRSTIELDNTGETTFALDAELRDAATSAGPLPDVELRLDAEGVRGERVRLELPVTMASQEYGRSDVKLEGSSSQTRDGMRTVDATLSGTRLALPDVERLLDLLAPPAAEQSAAAPVATAGRDERRSAIAKLRAVRHEAPAWTDQLRATASVVVDSVVMRAFTVDELRGALDVTPQRVSLRDLEASLLGARLNADANVRFDAARAKPYTLAFHAAIDALDLGLLFRSVAPGEEPMTEGVFAFETTLASEGLNPIDLGLSSLGEIRLEGRDGIFRGLEGRAGTGSTAAKAIGILTFSKEFRALGRLLDGLGTIRFEEATFLLDRAALDQIDLRGSVVSPQVSIDATGTLALAPRRPLLLSPLDVSARIAARGDVATLLDGMELLEADVNTYGYREIDESIQIGGTPAEPDASALWALLDEGASNAHGRYGFALRALNRRLERNEPTSGDPLD